MKHLIPLVPYLHTADDGGTSVVFATPSGEVYDAAGVLVGRREAAARQAVVIPGDAIASAQKAIREAVGRA